MRILYTFRSLAVWGGIERVLVEKMNHLVTMYGYEVYMLTTDQGNYPIPYQVDEGVYLDDLGIQFHKQYRYSGFRRIWDGWRRTRLYKKRLSERINQIRPDLIVCTTSDPVYSIVEVKGCIPLIVESHSICIRTLNGKGLRQRYVAKLLKKGLKSADRLVTLTEDDAAEWHKICPRVVVIPNIVHLNEGKISSLDHKRVIWVGRFDYQKRPMEIINIWRINYPQFPDWHLEIYGEGEQQQELETVARSLDMNIHIHQPTNYIFNAYRESSIFVSTSLFEPFGLVIPEAMSCGLPVVSYNCPFGPSTMISDGDNGFLVDNNNRSLFAARLSWLMSDMPLRQKMGKVASCSVQQFSSEHIMPMWKKLFENYY